MPPSDKKGQQTFVGLSSPVSTKGSKEACAVDIRASSNIPTGWANAYPVTTIAHPVASICPPRSKCKNKGPVRRPVGTTTSVSRKKKLASSQCPSPQSLQCKLFFLQWMHLNAGAVADLAFGGGGNLATLPTLGGGGGGASLQGPMAIAASKARMEPQRPMWALRGQCVTPKGVSHGSPATQQNRAIRDLIG